MAPALIIGLWGLPEIEKGTINITETSVVVNWKEGKEKRRGGIKDQAPMRIQSGQITAVIINSFINSIALRQLLLINSFIK